VPAVLATYAPRGKTPILKQTLSRDHLSAMSGITPEGKLYLKGQERAFKGPDVVSFLKHLLVHIQGPLLILWDRAPIHRSQAVKDFLSAGAAARIHLEPLPSYAPELNPDEGIWNYLKRVELKNLSCRNISHLRYELRKAKERLRHKTLVIRGYINQLGLY
jgi:transposase